jgi:uncharacterized protein (TIGR03790 family)
LGATGPANLKRHTYQRQDAASAFSARLMPLLTGFKVQGLTRRARIAAMNAFTKFKCYPIQFVCWFSSVLICAVASGVVHAQVPTAKQPLPQWLSIPKIHGRLTAKDVGLVINSADPYSVEVGEYYARRRGIPEEQVLRVDVPVKAQLNAAEFDALSERIREFMGPQVQALALAWTQPYSVACNSITSAITVGFDPQTCSLSCSPSRFSPYFNSPTARPFSDHGIRPSMLLASRSVAAAKSLIERGISSEQQLGKIGVPMASALFVSTKDTARNVRARMFPPVEELPGRGFKVVVREGNDDGGTPRVFLYQTGLANVPHPEQVQWLPGALADHLTSYGGVLLEANGQMSALEWLEAGATASYGTVSEPCNFVQKFPHPQILLLNYIQGATAIESYWRSVAWPAQGVFIGEPLAAPF